MSNGRVAISYGILIEAALIIGSLGQNSTVRDCGCDSTDVSFIPREIYPHEYEDSIMEGKYFYVLCCPKNLLSETAHKQRFQIRWEYRRRKESDPEPMPLEEAEDCGGQKIYKKILQKSHEGFYTCSVTSEDGSSATGTIFVKVRPLKKERLPPIPSPNQVKYAKKGDKLSLTCQFIVGEERDDVPITWHKITQKNELMMAEDLPGVRQSNVTLRNGTASAKLSFGAMKEFHFGSYCCMTKTVSSVTFQNFTIINGLSPEDERMVHMKKIFAVVVCAVAFLLVVCLLFFRFRYYFFLKMAPLKKYSKPRPRLPSSQGHMEEKSYDVFIIHGPTAVRWVDEVLLVKLEKKYGLKCFLPRRDLLAGEETLESIFQHLNESRRIVVVITDCLFRSQWCAYAMFQAIHTALSSSSKVLAILLADPSILKTKDYASRRLVNTLRCIRKIKWPLEYSHYLNIPETFEPDVVNVRDKHPEGESHGEKTDFCPSVLVCQTTRQPQINGITQSSNSNSLPPLTSATFVNYLSERGHPSMSHSNVMSLGPNKDKEHFERVSKWVSEHGNLNSNSPEEMNKNHLSGTCPSEPVNKCVIQEQSDLANGEGATRLYLNLTDEVRHPYLFHDDNIINCAQSPTSDTPFFIDGSTVKRKSSKKKFKEVILGNSEVIFWQKLQLHLFSHKATQNDSLK